MRFTIKYVESMAVIVFAFGLVAANAATHYLVPPVTPGAAPVNPYTDWGTAATSVIDVVKAAMTNSSSPRIIWVTNGVYVLTNTVTITNDVVLKSVNGRDVSIFDGKGLYRCFYLQHTNCVLDGLTITNGYATDGGAGIRMTGGTVTNCLIVNCLNTGAAVNKGSGITIARWGKGIIANCVIRNNIGSGSGGAGIALYNGSTSTVANCIIENNIVTSQWENSGGGIAVGYDVNFGQPVATIKNCLIRYNSARDSCGGIALGSLVTNTILIANCTIVSNYSSASSGGIGSSVGANITNAIIINCVIFSNQINNIFGVGTNAVAYSCSTWQSNQWSIDFILRNGNTTNDPKFTSFAEGNYRFNRTSPCFNSGTNQTDWMNSAVDLDGHRRILHGTADMGAYELFIPSGAMYRFR